MKKENLEIILEDINRNLDMILEGQQVLNGKIDNLERRNDERFDLINFKLDALINKIDAMANDLSVHRADTEAHHGIYRVKES